MGAIARLVTAGLWLMIGLGSTALPAQSLASGSPTAAGPTPTVLDVPYLPQSALLCGGAAVAMVERWWGRRGVYAQDFAPLVHPELGGILTTDLAAAARTRGWNTQVLDPTAEQVQRALQDGVPVIALIEVGHDRYHYVVVVGWNDGHVVFHDPAGAPFTTVSGSEFLAQWSRAHRWALAIRPVPAAETTTTIPTEGADPAPVEAMPCSPWLDRALDAVEAGDLDEAAQLLAVAGQACPAEPVVLRELAGVRFKQERYAEATALAGQYVALVPGDELGWQLLATGRYLTGDQVGALDAWNHIGRPTIDLLRIDGARRIRFRTIADAVSVPHGTVLSPSRLRLARRRLSDIPALRGSVVEYEPVPGGLVEVHAAIDERPTLESPWRLALAGAIRAVAQSEASLEVATPTGGGELWTASWRWEAARSRAAVGVEVPTTLGLPGVVRVEGAWERFRFALDSERSVLREESRRTALVGVSSWVRAGVHLTSALRLERWSADRTYLAISAGAERRTRDDRFTLSASTERAVSLSSSLASYTRADGGVSWVSALGLGHPAWSGRLGVVWASPDAPPGTWPIVGTDLAWALPLRAHPATSGGFLVGRNAGRTIIHAGLAGDHPVYRVGPLVLAAGLFLDGADVIRPLDGSGDRFYLDAGGGLRLGLAGGGLGVLRIDLASGLTDGRSALSVGVHRQWPLFR